MTQPSNLQRKSWWWWWRKWCLQPWVASRMLDNWRRGNAQRGEKAKSVRDCLPVMQIKIQRQRQLQKYKQIQIYTFTTERDDLGTVGFAWRIQNESSRASKNSEIFTKFNFPKKENANKFLRFSLCNICLNNCVCLSRRNGKNVTLFLGGGLF